MTDVCLNTIPNPVTRRVAVLIGLREVKKHMPEGFRKGVNFFWCLKTKRHDVSLQPRYITRSVENREVKWASSATDRLGGF